MPTPDDLNNFINRDIRSLEVLLNSRSNKTTLTIQEFINLSLLNGAAVEVIRDELVRDLREGGRIFSEFRSSLKNTVGGAIKRASDTGQVTYLEEITKYRWVAVADKNVCDDCIYRHGKSMSWEDWEKEGLPATGYTVCKERCRCVLIPDEITKIEPVSLEALA